MRNLIKRVMNVHNKAFTEAFQGLHSLSEGPPHTKSKDPQLANLCVCVCWW